MSIQLHTPTSPLNQHIVCFWHVNHRVTYRQEKILPTGTIELMINFGGPHLVHAREGQDETQMARSWLAGFQTTYILNEPLGRTEMLGVRFKPGGAYPFFEEPLSLFHNQIENMEAVWGNLMTEIRERLGEIETPAARFQALEAILLKRLRRGQTPTAYVGAALNRLAASGGHLPLQELCARIGISPKQLIARFKAEVGVTPKQYGRVLKLQQVLGGIDPQRPLAWGEIASQANYYDQSHFNRDFRRFTGLTPADYLTYRARFFGPDLSAGDSVHFVPIR